MTAEWGRADVDSDKPLVEAAQRLMAMLDAERNRAGRYRVDARGAQGVQIGDYNVQSNVFNAPNA